tara:strand:- start:448 stop:636 length:189 start_codon:yes stop_codon:yes gene_type:complete
MNGPLDWLRMLDIAAVCAACVGLIFAMVEISPLFGFGIVVLVCLAAWRFVLPHVAANTLKGT